MIPCYIQRPIITLPMQFFRFFIFVIVLIATILMCLWPDFHPERKVVHGYYWQVDMLIHGGYYFVACLIILSLRLSSKPLYLSVGLFLLSVMLEILQYYSHGRSVSVMDIGSNFLGITLATGLFLVLRNRSQVKSLRS